MDGQTSSVYDSSKLSVSIVKNATQEMFKHHYLFQEAITPNHSRHLTKQQLKFLKISESNLSLDLKTPKVYVSEVC